MCSNDSKPECPFGCTLTRRVKAQKTQHRRKNDFTTGIMVVFHAKNSDWNKRNRNHRSRRSVHWRVFERTRRRPSRVIWSRSVRLSIGEHTWLTDRRCPTPINSNWTSDRRLNRSLYVRWETRTRSSIRRWFFTIVSNRISFSIIEKNSSIYSSPLFHALKPIQETPLDPFGTRQRTRSTRFYRFSCAHIAQSSLLQLRIPMLNTTSEMINDCLLRPRRTIVMFLEWSSRRRRSHRNRCVQWKSIVLFALVDLACRLPSVAFSCVTKISWRCQPKQSNNVERWLSIWSIRSETLFGPITNVFIVPILSYAIDPSGCTNRTTAKPPKPFAIGWATFVMIIPYCRMSHEWHCVSLDRWKSSPFRNRPRS